MLKNSFFSQKKIALLIIVIVSLAATLIFFQYGHLNPSNYKIHLSDFKYKFQPALQNVETEMDYYKKKIEQTKNPSDIDLAALADLYLTEAKRSGSIANYEMAEKLAHQALESKVQNKNAHLILIKVMIARHQFQEALTQIDNSMGPSLSEAGSSLRASIYMALGQYQQALEQINFLLKVKPGMGSVTLKALALGYLGQDDLAFYYFKKALLIEDLGEEVQSVFTRAQFAQFLIKKGNVDQALELCDSALSILPENPFAQFVKSQAFVAKQNYKQAYKLLQSAFAVSKEPVYLLHMIYITKIQQDDDDFKVLSERALQIYTAEVQSNGFGHLADLANLHFVMGNYAEALKVALQNRLLRKNLRSEVSLAKILIKMNRSEEARDVVERQIATGASEVELFYLMKNILSGDHNAELKQVYQNKIKENNNRFNEAVLMVIP